MIRRALVAIAWLFLAAPVFALQPSPSNEFVPMNQVPPSEQLPAAPLVVAAYAFVWIALFIYLLSIWRRLGKVEAEMQALDRRAGDRTGSR